MEFDIVMVIALVIAVVVFLQLRSVLGKRTGFERPPFDPNAPEMRKQSDDAPSDNVVSLPKREARQPDDFSDIDNVSAAGSELNDGLRAIRKADPSFSPQSFVDGVRVAYEMIVTAFANGDKNGLKALLSKDVYEGFSQAIDARKKNGESVRFTFVGIDKAEIVDAEMQDADELVTMRIVSEIISATYDSDEKLVDGDPEVIAEITDIWTFSRNSRSRDPNWKLVATQDDQ
ncbi:Tim44/TimA family putative adaptor protein [Bartonella sp. LJL80]